MVTYLFIKPQSGQPLLSVDRFSFSKNGILNNVPCLPLRQVLILSQSTLEKFHLNPGDLRENIVVDYDNLYELSSGSVLKIGEALIRLTFHCEPCKSIKDKVNIKDITHQRGFLGSFLNYGTIHIGNEVVAGQTIFEPIPYKIIDRLRWYLDKQKKPVDSMKLLYDIGLSKSYARTIPSMLKKLPQ